MSLTHLIRQSKNDKRKWLQLKRKAVDLEFETYKESFLPKDTADSRSITVVSL